MPFDARRTLADAWRNQRWSLPIVLPVFLALTLLVVLAAQLAHATHFHRHAVDASLRDYSSFAAWQYARRASDYLRLVVGTTVPYAAFTQQAITVRAGCENPSADGREVPACLMPLPTQGFLRARVQDGVVSLDVNHSALTSETALRSFRAALAHVRQSGMRIGLESIGDTTDARTSTATTTARSVSFLGFTVHGDSASSVTGMDAVVLSSADLAPVFAHVMHFAPLLPPSFVDSLPNDSLVSLEIRTAPGALLATLGRPSDGLSATDELGPDLGGLRVRALLHPAATGRLVAGALPPSNSRALIAMLAVTLVLCAVAVLQVRKMQEIVRVRSDFVASVSHELKTPLAQISLFADTLASARDRPQDERRHYASIISQEAKRLGHLVDGILHFARMTRSDAPAASAMTQDMVVLGDEIRSAVAAFAPLAESRSVTLETRIARDVTMSVERDGFRQLLVNLFDNALKYGPDGQRIVVALDASDSEARITVDDQGPGVPMSARARIFEPFVRLDQPGGRGGSGIGLAVVRDVVARHGGAVRLTDAPSGGARVEFAFPLSA